MGAIMEHITLAELAEQSGGNYDTLYRKARRTFPAETWSKDSALSPEHIAALSGKKTKSSRREKPAATTRPAPPVSLAEMVTPKSAYVSPRRQYGLVALMLTATAASVQNMYRVTAELSEANMSAILLTVVLSASALVFVASGVRRWWTGALAGLLIAYESMCNMTRIHAGLYDQHGNATRFLSQFCDTFNTGTHASAFSLALFTSFFIAAVQYAAIFELNRK